MEHLWPDLGGFVKITDEGRAEIPQATGRDGLIRGAIPADSVDVHVYSAQTLPIPACCARKIMLHPQCAAMKLASRSAAQAD